MASPKLLSPTADALPLPTVGPEDHVVYPPAVLHAHSECLPRQNCDMNEEMRTDCVDLVITAIERYANNYEVTASPAPSDTSCYWSDDRRLV